MAGRITPDVLGPKETATELLRFLAEAGYLWSYRGQADKASAVFGALVLLAGKDPVGHQGLAEVYLAQGKFREAEREADLAARAAGGDRRTTAFAYKLRGRALIQLNRLKEAEKALLRAAEIDRDGIEGRAAQELLQTARQMGIFPASDGKSIE